MEEDSGVAIILDFTSEGKVFVGLIQALMGRLTGTWTCESSWRFVHKWR